MTTTPTSGEPAAHGPDGGQDGRRGRDGRLRRVWQRRAFRLAVGVVAAAVALTAATVAFAQVAGPFRDVGNDHYARESVQWAVQHGITFGCRDGYFCPETTVNRAESVTFLHRYQNNVVDPRLDRIEADISRLQGQPSTTPATPATPATPSPPAFGYIPPPTPSPPIREVVRGTERTDYQPITALLEGTYDVVFTVLATSAAKDHDDSTSVDGIQDIDKIVVEYKSGVHTEWATIAVSGLQLTKNGSTLPTDDPTDDSLLQSVKQVNVEVLAETLSNLPTKGQIRVSAYTVPYDPDGPTKPKPNAAQRTTKYRFSWDVVLTEVRD